MDEVEGVHNGTYDYMQLKGDTGPLVPALPRDIDTLGVPRWLRTGLLPTVLDY